MKAVFSACCLCLGVVLTAGAFARESDALRAAHDTYRTCATLHLPDNFAKVQDPRTAAGDAVDRCEKQRLALAGQYALDNPGARNTGFYIDTARGRVAADLATWVLDMKTLGVQVGMQPAR